MAVSIVNYPQTSEASNLVSLTDEKISLSSFLPPHAQQALPRLPIFETVAVLPQHQTGKGANKSIHSFNNLYHDFKNPNSFPRFVPRNSSSTNRHSMYCGDFPSHLQHQITRSNSSNKSPKMRRRAASFGENSVVHNNIINNSTTKSLNKKSFTPLIINVPSKTDIIRSPKSSPKENSSPKNSPKSSTMQQHIEVKQEILDINKIQKIETIEKDESHGRTFSTDSIQNSENLIENPQSNNSSNLQNSQSKPNNRGFFRHTIILNNNASGSSTELRKSIHKEPSFTKKLRKVFSLSNIRQDDHNSNSKTSVPSSTANSRPSSPVFNHRFSSLRGKKYHLCNLNGDDNSSSNNNDKDDDTSESSTSSNGNILATTKDFNSNNKSRRRTFDFQSLFSKNENKRNKKDRQNNQQQRHKSKLEQSFSYHQIQVNERDDSLNEVQPIGNENGNGNKQVSDDSAPIPPRASSLQSLNDQQASSNKVHHQNSTSPLQNPFRVKKSENHGEEQNNNSPVSSSLQPPPSRDIKRPSSLPATAKNQVPSLISPTPRRLSVPVPLNSNASRSDPSLVVVRDIDVSPAPSTPTAKKLQFSSSILVHETWTREDYDRRGDQSTCNKLTSILAQRIKQELNEYKMSEMQVHEDSKHNTHFFS
ncbi:16181_t:CDS:2 [Funneliformis mosseae]|uniref:16181_t:CDS:1 n=1 Tax=Funneliformis mosseae TaxID=27381 RepID=A0A9N9BHM8_FUNMO|nr:16181_t:CDS:2 [Funneliformis mosseae]